jgi:hypothetical protein
MSEEQVNLSGVVLLSENTDVCQQGDQSLATIHAQEISAGALPTSPNSGVFDWLLHAFEELNEFLKQHDPLSNFPLPSANALRAHIPSYAATTGSPISLAGVTQINVMSLASDTRRISTFGSTNLPVPANDNVPTFGVATSSNRPGSIHGNTPGYVPRLHMVQPNAWVNVPLGGGANHHYGRWTSPIYDAARLFPAFGSPHDTLNNHNNPCTSNLNSAGSFKGLGHNYLGADSHLSESNKFSSTSRPWDTQSLKSWQDTDTWHKYPKDLFPGEPDIYDPVKGWGYSNDYYLKPEYILKESARRLNEERQKFSEKLFGESAKHFEYGKSSDTDIPIPTFKVDPIPSRPWFEEQPNIFTHTKFPSFTVDPSFNLDYQNFYDQYLNAQADAATGLSPGNPTAFLFGAVGTEAWFRDAFLVLEKAERGEIGTFFIRNLGRTEGWWQDLMPKIRAAGLRAQEDQKLMLERSRISFTLESPQARLEREEAMARDMTSILHSLIKLFILFGAHGIPVDKGYLHDILGLNAGLASQVLQNELAREALIKKARWEYKRTHPKPGTAGSGSSGGGDGGNQTGGPGFRFDKDLEQELKDAIHEVDKDRIISIFERRGWKLDRAALDKVPEHLKLVGISGIRLAKSVFNPKNPRGGIIFEDKRRGHSIRIMQGNPDYKMDYQLEDYVQLRSGGKVLGKDGREISNKDFNKPRKHKDAHIPLNEWMKWERWNKK